MRFAISSIILCFFFLGCTGKTGRRVCVNHVCIYAEFADSEPKRQQGLMFRKFLPDNAGMLFLFDQEARHSFWMENMKFPLDIIWISRDKKIVDIKTNVPLCDKSCESLIPKDIAKYVLEVNAGFVRKNQIKIGDKLNF